MVLREREAPGRPNQHKPTTDAELEETKNICNKQYITIRFANIYREGKYTYSETICHLWYSPAPKGLHVKAQGNALGMAPQNIPKP